MALDILHNFSESLFLLQWIVFLNVIFALTMMYVHWVASHSSKNLCKCIKKCPLCLSTLSIEQPNPKVDKNGRTTWTLTPLLLKTNKINMYLRLIVIIFLSVLFIDYLKTKHHSFLTHLDQIWLLEQFHGYKDCDPHGSQGGFAW